MSERIDSPYAPLAQGRTLASRVKLLIVDQDSGWRSAAAAALGAEVDVAGCETVSDALERLRDSRFDVVLLGDVGGNDRLDTAISLVRSASGPIDAPRIFVAALHDTTQGMADAIDAGADLYFGRKQNPHRLRDTVVGGLLLVQKRRRREAESTIEIPLNVAPLRRPGTYFFKK